MTQEELIEELAQFSHDPLGFVLFAFPWGEPGSELEEAAGPEAWQVDLLEQVRDGLITLEEALLFARTSGHGIGKSAMVAWLILWAMSTFPDTIGVVTANTENQLKTKTWVQVAKWYRLFIGRGLFKFTATAIFSVDPEHERTWRMDMVPWSERNTEAFAGLHNKGRRILVIFDEASAIPDQIFEVTEGALTDSDTEILWFLFGNPTKNTGRFRECFEGGRFAHRWNHAAVDSREVSLTNKEQIERWIADYGEDSDFVRIRVKGEFPRVDSQSFISLERARSAVRRAIEDQVHWPLVMGVDVARFGDDFSVIYFRRGRDGSSIPPILYQGLSTVELASRVSSTFLNVGAQIVFVDEGGVGGGVVDRLRQLGVPVHGVDFGRGPDGINEMDPQVRYANKRAEIWGAMRDWLEIGSIVDEVNGSEVGLVAELTAPTYGHTIKEAILLESKKDMRRRGVPSPNVADALALTFSLPVAPVARNALEMPKAPMAEDYNPFTKEAIYGVHAA